MPQITISNHQLQEVDNSEEVQVLHPLCHRIFTSHHLATQLHLN